MVSPVVPLHLGPLHPIESGLTLALAFGPFLLLAVVVVIRRRQDERAERAERAEPDRVETPAAQRDR